MSQCRISDTQVTDTDCGPLCLITSYLFSVFELFLFSYSTPELGKFQANLASNIWVDEIQVCLNEGDTLFHEEIVKIS